MGASLTHDDAHFSSGCGIMVGLGKPKLCTKFEVANPAVAEILWENPKFWGAPLAHGHPHLFVWV